MRISSEIKRHEPSIRTVGPQRQRENEGHKKDLRSHTPSTPMHSQRNTPEAGKGTKSLDELRAILRTISSAESSKKNDVPEEKKARTEGEDRSSGGSGAEQKKKPEEPSLKQALASALKTDIPKDQSSEARMDRKEPAVAPQSTILQPVPEERPKTVVSEYAKEAIVAVDEDPLSPKKLERMMRVTGSDRTPLG